jgi:hypothetical protein
VSDGIPASLTANDLRRIADALEEHNILKREEINLRRAELTGEIQKRAYHGKRKDPAIWIRSSQEVVRLLETKPFVDWEDVKELPAFRDPGKREDHTDGANMTRIHQWRWFLRQHAIPRTPEYGDAHLVAVGEEDKYGPPATTLKGNEHCAKRAFDHVPDTDTRGDYGGLFDANCGRCVAERKLEEGEAANKRLAQETARIQEAVRLGLTSDEYAGYLSWKRWQYGKNDAVDDYKTHLARLAAKNSATRPLTEEEQNAREEERRARAAKVAEAQKKRLATLAANKGAPERQGG